MIVCHIVTTTITFYISVYHYHVIEKPGWPEVLKYVSTK